MSVLLSAYLRRWCSESNRRPEEAVSRRWRPSQEVSSCQTFFWRRPSSFMKFIELMLSVSAGLTVGKEEPLVHVACCWSNMLATLSSKYKRTESQRRQLTRQRPAVGVSAASGAPIGGVFFSYGKVSSMFSQKTMIRSLFADCRHDPVAA